MIRCDQIASGHDRVLAIWTRLRASLKPSVLAALAFFCGAAFLALYRLHPVYFNPVNGDFQTFNAVSRFLSGQWPYHDFANYLGVGPLLIASLAAAPGGVTLASSIAGTDVAASLCFLLMAVFALRLLGVAHAWIYAVGLYFLGRAVCFIQLLPFNEITHAMHFFVEVVLVHSGLRNLVYPGHSLMVFRALWPFIAALPLLWYFTAPSARRAALLGVTLGAGVAWSNDYGPVTALAFGIFFAWRARAPGHWAALAATAPLGLLATVTAITGGNPGAWWLFNREVAADQFWYYYFPIDKVVDPFSIDFDNSTFLLLLVWLSCAVAVQRARRAWSPAAATFAAIYLACALTGTLSMFGSFWYLYYLSSSVFLAICMLIAHYEPTLGPKLRRHNHLIGGVFAILAGAMLVGILLLPGAAPRTPDEARLGARLSHHFDGFDTMMNFIRQGDQNIWSTYATAVEATLGIRQPSGQDYIIHALGTSGRRKYLDTFQEIQPRLVITPRVDVIIWEVWSRIINWNFYRHVVRNYQPAFQGPYWTVWRKTENPTSPLPLACHPERVSDNAVRIVVQADPDRVGHVADVELDYHAEAPFYSRLLMEVEDNFLRNEVIKSVVKQGLNPDMHQLQSSVGLPSNPGSWHIPVRIDAAGRGESVLRANAKGRAQLTVRSCKAQLWAPPGRLER